MNVKISAACVPIVKISAISAFDALIVKISAISPIVKITRVARHTYHPPFNFAHLLPTVSVSFYVKPSIAHRRSASSQETGWVLFISAWHRLRCIGGYTSIVSMRAVADKRKLR